MKKRRINIKWNNILFLLTMLMFFTFLMISIYNIVKWKIDSNKTNRDINTIQKNINIEEVPNTERTQIIKPVEEVPKENPYWDYINMNMINVDFYDLKKTNPDVVGWLKVNGTNINYPFVQTKDNKYYLTHDFNKTYNEAGWVFLDYRNDKTNNKNTIIYAHARNDKTMFGSLKNVLSNGWLNNTNNYVVKISTETENTLWQVFSVYHIPTSSDYLQTSFSNNTEYQEFLNMIKNRSSYTFNTNVSTTDNILTLSTCFNTVNDKLVMHAKLIKKEVK